MDIKSLHPSVKLAGFLFIHSIPTESCSGSQRADAYPSRVYPVQPEYRREPTYVYNGWSSKRHTESPQLRTEPTHHRALADLCWKLWKLWYVKIQSLFDQPCMGMAHLCLALFSLSFFWKCRLFFYIHHILWLSMCIYVATLHTTYI